MSGAYKEASMGLKERIENNAVVWFLGAVVACFLAGIGTYEGILRIAKLEVVSQDRQQRYEMLVTKDRFMSLYLRFALAHLEPFKFEVTNEDRQAAKEKLDKYMLEYIENADKSESIVAVGKGHGKQTTIKFPDGSIWVVPPAFRAATGD
jgi:hypothetical protein